MNRAFEDITHTDPIVKAMLRRDCSLEEIVVGLSREIKRLKQRMRRKTLMHRSAMTASDSFGCSHAWEYRYRQNGLVINEWRTCTGCGARQKVIGGGWADMPRSHAKPECSHCCQQPIIQAPDLDGWMCSECCQPMPGPQV